MKRSSKIIAIFLALLMVSSLFCLPVTAEEAEDPYAPLKKGIGYIAIGDSFTRGFGASPTWADEIYKSDEYGIWDCRNVTGSYPNRIAEHFGLNTPSDIRDLDGQFWPLTHDAVSTAYILDLLGIDDGYRDDEFTYQDGSMIRRYHTDLAYYGDPLSTNFEGTAPYGQTGEIMSIRYMFENASLFTIGLGQTDIIYKAQILGLDDVMANPSVETIGALIERIYNYFEYWKKAYPMLLDYIKEVNPDAKVVLVGTMNPIQNASLDKDILFPLGSALNIIMDLMNIFNRECAEKYGYMFVDISNVETPPTIKDMTISEILSLTGDEYKLVAHPTQEGYKQIARMIIDTIEKDLGTAEPAPKTYIKTDIGAVKRIDSVLLDGKSVKYTYEDGVLTIPCKRTDAKLLAISATGEDGSAVAVTYALNYTSDGYYVRRITRTNNVIDAIMNALKVFFNTIKDLFSKLFSGQ